MDIALTVLQFIGVCCGFLFAFQILCLALFAFILPTRAMKEKHHKAVADLHRTNMLVKAMKAVAVKLKEMQ